MLPVLDPASNAAVHARHKLLRLGTLTTLVPGDKLTWLIMTTTANPFAIKDVLVGQRLNTHVTSVVHGLQSEADHLARRKTPAQREEGRQAALFLTIALHTGGRKLMSCLADEPMSRQIAETAKDCFERVRGGAPIGRELIRLQTELDRLNCILV